MIVYNKDKVSNYFGMVNVNTETGKITAIGEERGREGGWYWLEGMHKKSSPVKGVLLELDKDFEGIYDRVKKFAFAEEL